MPQRKKRKLIAPFGRGLLLLCMITASREGLADEKDKNVLPAPNHYKSSTTVTGTLGLNTVPSARVDEKGTIRLGVGTEDPYLHSFLGFQITDPLYVGLRQTAEVSSLTGSPKSLHPGIDLKLRLFEETATRPAVAVGFESAYGLKRMGSEYLTFSKRYNSFDFTGGVAWGRLGSAGHIKNPLRKISSHFEKRRSFNSNQPQDVGDWFTGEDIGFFGGVEYHTPLDGLSVKAEYGANDYTAEQLINGFDAPQPWSVSLNYKPWNQIDLSAGIIGGEKIMARLSLQDNAYNWPGRSYQKREAPDLISPRQPIDLIEEDLTRLSLSPYQSTATQVGYRARLMANNTPPDQEKIYIETRHKNIKGPNITLIRKDLERALIDKKGSPEEIWQDTEIEKNSDPFYTLNNAGKHDHLLRFILDTRINVAQDRGKPLYRSALLVDLEKTWPYGFVTGTRGRLNIRDNLSRLRPFRLPAYLTTRADDDAFAARRVSIDKMYGSWMHSLNGNTHIAATGSYLEEMFFGLGGELLYRPFGKSFAIGFDGWRAYKRNPYTTFNKEFSKKGKTTGHLNLFYELPKNDVTLYTKIGQYLKEDFGGTVGVKTRFNNGASLEGFITATDEPDFDFFGDSAHVHGGIKLALPLGNIPFIPDGSEFRLTTEPFSRETGQILERPLELYDVTEPVSYRRLSRGWKNLLE